MSHHFAATALEASGRVGQGLAMGHYAIQDAMRTIKTAQRDDRHAVVRLADRLDEVRDAEAAALNRAARAEAELAHARQQIRELEILLDRQTRLVNGFREICGV